MMHLNPLVDMRGGDLCHVRQRDDQWCGGLGVLHSGSPHGDLDFHGKVIWFRRANLYSESDSVFALEHVKSTRGEWNRRAGRQAQQGVINVLQRRPFRDLAQGAEGQEEERFRPPAFVRKSGLEPKQGCPYICGKCRANYKVHRRTFINS
ncbi:hypothetical protein OQ252_04635 [Acetobacter farinalis]|uniref:Uncharacterized protein n=1 Tax=Acetobacter farinalis TaxID=1260984 RepID=A0ABT3Q5Z3_9PROT|nr:hypothetical protein [Acetobacter farinalis]MCX2560690.1 hypothetical protein [Acetobacter farinalis]NHO29170.1 hypothetical protein [Acetobacter farinalis]